MEQDYTRNVLSHQVLRGPAIASERHYLGSLDAHQIFLSSKSLKGHEVLPLEHGPIERVRRRNRMRVLD